MKTTFKIFVLVTISVLTSCISKQKSPSGITVSILPQKYVVDNLMDGTVPVNVLIPAGSSPATYSPSPAKIKGLGESKLYLKIGHIGFEQAWTGKISEINPNLVITDTSNGISFIRGEDYVHGDHVHKGGIDPHIWTSPKTMLTVIKNTQVALSKEFPEQKTNITKNAQVLIEKIKKLDLEFEERCNSFTQKSFYIFHPAYTYLARDYGLKQISIEHKGKEPSAQWLKTLIDNGRENNIKAIFIQEEFDKRNAEIIAKELNIPAIQVNPLSLNWEKEMKNTLSKLENALK